MPTASQVYLAVDLLNAFALGDIAPTPKIQARCIEILDDALSVGTWTGRVENGCVEYGRPAMVDDPLASLKIKAFDRIAEAHKNFVEQGTGCDTFAAAVGATLDSLPKMK